MDFAFSVTSPSASCSTYFNIISLTLKSFLLSYRSSSALKHSALRSASVLFIITVNPQLAYSLSPDLTHKSITLYMFRYFSGFISLFFKNSQLVVSHIMLWRNNPAGPSTLLSSVTIFFWSPSILFVYD